MLLLSPQTGIAQELVPHGTVVRVQGETIEVEVSSLYRVPEDATGTVFTQNEVGRLERMVKVARLDVAAVRDGVVTARVTDRIDAVALQAGFNVAFTPVGRKGGALPNRGLLRLATVPTGAKVKATPLRASATGRTLPRASRSLGPTPLADSLMPGRYRLTVRKAGYRSARRSVVLRADSVVTDTLRLQQKNLGRR